MREDCKSFNRKDLRRCGINIGSKLCTKPQKKKRLVTSIKGKSQLLVWVLLLVVVEEDIAIITYFSFKAQIRLVIY